MDEDADQRREHALRHRPSGQRHAGVNAVRVSLRDDAAVVDDDHGVGASQACRVGLVERAVHDATHFL